MAQEGVEDGPLGRRVKLFANRQHGFRFDSKPHGAELGATLADVAAQYLADLQTRGAKPSSIRQARSALERVLGGLAAVFVHDLTKPGVEGWKRTRLSAGSSHRTVNHEVGVLKAALNLAMGLGQIGVSPLAGMRSLPTTARHRRRRARALSEDEIVKLLKAAAAADVERPKRFPQEPLLRALILTGARWSELVHTVWADLDLDGQMLTLRAENTKTSDERRIPLDPWALEGVLALRREHTRVRHRLPTPDVRIFLTSRGSKWGADTANFRRYLHVVMKRAGIEYSDAVGRVLHVHALRHTFCTRLLRAGTPVQVAQRLTGHKTATMLLHVYNGMGMEGTRAALLSMPRIDTFEGKTNEQG